MLIKKLLITFCVMALVVGCSNEQPTSPVVNEDVETIGTELTDTTSVNEERDVTAPIAAKLGAYMYVSWPFYNWSSSSGWTTYSKVWSHKGADKYSLDISRYKCYGIGVYAGIAGRVIEATKGCHPSRADGCNGGYGNTVVVYDYSRHVAVRYSHLSYVNVSKGQWVRYRQYIGKIGNSGTSTGSHLHITAYENINDNYGNPIIPNSRDAEYFACQIRWRF